MSEYTVLPLLNSAFKPGTAVEVVERFEDSDFRNIARAELFYFSGRNHCQHDHTRSGHCQG